jgi:serine/threonine protein kinase
MSCRILLRCVGMAIADKGMRGLMGVIPFGECFYDIASCAYDRYTSECCVESRMEEIASAAGSSMDQIKDQAREVLAEIIQQTDSELRTKLDDPLVQNNMLGYLEQIPGAIRASLKRPSDPSGKSLPKSFTLSSADDFLKILPTRPPRFKAGDMPVGNWKLLDLLGVGGFGEVWKAEHPSLKGIPPVALKFCLAPDSARFLRHEGELLSRVMEVSANNPGIVKLRQAYIESDTPCLEYEFINGGDLCGLMSEWLNMPKERRTLLALQMLVKLARTIAPLHTMNPPIVHRDLKPANVLVVRTTDGKINLKIGDFGIGGLATKQAIEGQSKGASQGEILTQTLRGSHTPLYAGPEQQRGAPPHPTDDVHALGVIGFQLLVSDLRRGPTGDWDEELRELGVSDPIIAMFKQCIARQARRYPHAGVLADELQNLIDSKPSTAAKPALLSPQTQSAIAQSETTGTLQSNNSTKTIKPKLSSHATNKKPDDSIKNKNIFFPILSKNTNFIWKTFMITIYLATAFIAIFVYFLIFDTEKKSPAKTNTNKLFANPVLDKSKSDNTTKQNIENKNKTENSTPLAFSESKPIPNKPNLKDENKKNENQPDQWKNLSKFVDLDKHWKQGDSRGNFKYDTGNETILLNSLFELGTIIYTGNWSVLTFEMHANELSDKFDLEINKNTLMLGRHIKLREWQKIEILYKINDRTIIGKVNGRMVESATVLKPISGSLTCMLSSGMRSVLRIRKIEIWTGISPP